MAKAKCTFSHKQIFYPNLKHEILKHLIKGLFLSQ